MFCVTELTTIIAITIMDTEERLISLKNGVIMRLFRSYNILLASFQDTTFGYSIYIDTRLHEKKNTRHWDKVIHINYL